MYSRGQDVRQLQRALNAQGANLRVDGIYGPLTRGALTNQLHRDGYSLRTQPAGTDLRAPRAGQPPPAGTTPAGELARTDDLARNTRRVAATPAPAGLNERQRFEHYANIVRANGGQVNPNEQPTVLGIRSRGESTRQYDDRFVVLTPDGRVREFAGATHPGQTRSSLSPDVNRDGAGDVGMIRPGNYNVRASGPYKGYPGFHVRRLDGSDRIPGWRDTNHDGVYSGAERTASERRGDTLTDVLFHAGNPGSPRSIGCLTLDPRIYNQFVAAVGGRNGRFNFTLVNGE